MSHFSKSSYLVEFNRLGSRIKKWDIPILALLCLVDKNKGILGFRGGRDFIRKLRATQLREDLYLGNVSDVKIEILVVVAGKDIHLLQHCLKAAILCTRNQISKITTISPPDDVKQCIEQVSGMETKIQFECLDENDFFGKKWHDQLQSKFGNRFGWVYQQLITLKFVQESTSHGVLVLDADTLLLKPAEWLGPDGNQIMLVSLEKHPPYYNFLSEVIKTPKNPKNTFVTHHMLFQPHLVRAIIARTVGELDSLIQKLLEFEHKDLQSPVCIEFEFYGQGMSRFFKEKIDLRKFANIGVHSGVIENLNFDQFYRKLVRLPYNSISFHEYMARDFRKVNNIEIENEVISVLKNLDF